MKRYLYAMLLSVCPVISWAADVTVKADPNDASRIEYFIQDDDCRISWFVNRQKPDNKSFLSMTQQCPHSFADQVDLHEDILEKINKDFSLTGFTSLQWGMFTYHNDNSWVIPIALASDKSDTYFDYRKNYPHAKVNDLNQIFIELANSTHAYQPLADLFREYNLTLVLKEAEKVFTSRADKLTFYPELRDQSVGQHARIMYDAGMTWFQIIPIPQD